MGMLEMPGGFESFDSDARGTPLAAAAGGALAELDRTAGEGGESGRACEAAVTAVPLELAACSFEREAK